MYSIQLLSLLRITPISVLKIQNCVINRIPLHIRYYSYKFLSNFITFDQKSFLYLSIPEHHQKRQTSLIIPKNYKRQKARYQSLPFPFQAKEKQVRSLKNTDQHMYSKKWWAWKDMVWKVGPQCHQCQEKDVQVAQDYLFGLIQFGNIINNNMADRAQNSRHKKRYSKISTEKRIKLVQMIQEEGFTLTKAAKLLHIKRPTAKIILSRYKQTGTFFDKKNIQPRPLPILPLGPRHLQDSEKIEQEENKESEPSMQLKVEEKEVLSPNSTIPYIGFNPYGLVYFYHHCFDYHAFM